MKLAEDDAGDVDGPDAAKREIALYFRDEEICAGELTLRPWLRASDEA